jgi:hypothetical protein
MATIALERCSARATRHMPQQSCAVLVILDTTTIVLRTYAPASNPPKLPCLICRLFPPLFRFDRISIDHFNSWHLGIPSLGATFAVHSRPSAIGCLCLQDSSCLCIHACLPRCWASDWNCAVHIPPGATEHRRTLHRRMFVFFQ